MLPFQGAILYTANPQPMALPWAEINRAFSAHYQLVNWLLSLPKHHFKSRELKNCYNNLISNN